MVDILENIIEVIIWIAPILLCFFLYKRIKKRYLEKFNRFEIEYLLKTYKLKKFSGLTSLFYAFSISMLIFYVSYIIRVINGEGMKLWFFENSLTHLAIFTTLFIGFWGLVVSYNVLKQQSNQIVSFEDFLSELQDSLYRLQQKAVKNNQKNYYVYIYDYHPLIGNYSSPEKYNGYKSELDNILKIDNIKVNLITNHEDGLSDFFKKLSIDNDHIILDNSFKASDFIKSVEGKSTSAIIWKGLSISQFHFIIIEDEAFQYVVLPKNIRGKNKNSLFGLKSEDPFTINYLLNSFNEKLSKTISPIKFIYKNGFFEIYFEPQSNIESIKLIKTNSIEDKPFYTINKNEDLIEYNENDIQGFRIKEFDIKNSLPFYYKLFKKNGSSVKSHPVFYRELYNSISDVHIVKYVFPELVPNKMDSCLSQLEEINAKNHILCIAVFYDNTEFTISNLNNQINASKFSEVPVQFVAQKPEKSIAFELVIVPRTNAQSIEYLKGYNFKYSKYTIDGMVEYYFSSNPLLNQHTLEENTHLVIQKFENLLNSLNTENIDLKKKIHRQWNYVSNITDRKEVNGIKVDNYDQFCKIRAEYYSNWGLTPEEYPVATGVHIDGTNEFAITAIVLNSSTRTIRKKNLKSRKQIFPYNYSDKVTSGTNKPFFNRASRIFIDDVEEYLFVAGTASIKGEESHSEDPDRLLSQLNTTIDSINHIINFDIANQISIRNMIYMRVYYYDEAHLYKLKTYLNPIISVIPHIFLKTRICRDNLLLEIETGKY